MDYRDDDVRGTGYCPHCGRVIQLDVSLFGQCDEHGRVPSDFTRPAPRIRVGGTVELSDGRRTTVLALSGKDVWLNGIDHEVPVAGLIPVYDDDEEE